MRTIATIGLLMLLTSMPAKAAALEQYLIDQLTCLRQPDPTPVLYSLKSSGRIGESVARGDSISCWELSPPIELEGIQFTHICAAHDEPFVIDTFPEFYWRGPGTSSGVRISLLTKASQQVLQPWREETLSGAIFDNSETRIHPASLVEGLTEVGCGR